MDRGITPTGWRPYRERRLDSVSLRVLGRRVSHLTPQYAISLARVRAFELAHPDAPWLTPQCVAILESTLRPTDRGLEYGSGRSTRWFAQRIAHLVSVETDPGWYHKTRQLLVAAGVIDRVDYRFASADDRAACVGTVDDLADSSLDFALVDGAYRDGVALRAVEVLRPGALLVLDNANRYLPAPHGSQSPLSTNLPVSADWARFAEVVHDWRVIWTSSGVTDTAIWIRPCDCEPQPPPSAGQRT
jgi:predicted O-methyltransferase YrrM